MARVFIVLLVVTTSLTGCGHQNNRGSGSSKRNEENSLADVIARIEPSVVRINTQLNGTEQALGSGFVVDSSGLIATNHHVINGADGAEVVFSDGTRVPVEGVAAIDVDRDIAVLKIKSEATLTAVEFCGEIPKKGESTLALGAPKGLSFTATEGIVSAIRSGDELAELGGTVRPGQWIQTSASITSGNSGGPLFDRNGRVIGMNSFILKDSGNVGFALSADDITDVVKKAREQKTLSSISESAKTPESKGTLSPEMERRVEELVKAVTAASSDRLRELEDARSTLTSLTIELKAAKIEGDVAAQNAVANSYHATQQTILKLIEQPLSLPLLSPDHLRTLQVGRFSPDHPFRILQVWDREAGLLLLSDDRGSATFLVRGLDTTDAIDGKRIRMAPTLIFAVLGTHTYETVLGAAKTIFVLECSANTADLNDYGPFRQLATAEMPDPELTVDEQGLAAKNINARLLAEKEAEEMERIKAEEAESRLMAEAKRQEVERARAAEMKRVAEEADATLAKIKRAESRLEQAKKLIERQNLHSATKYLKEIVSEVPGTEVAKQAERLLKRMSN